LKACTCKQNHSLLDTVHRLLAVVDVLARMMGLNVYVVLKVRPNGCQGWKQFVNSTAWHRCHTRCGWRM